MSTRGLCNSGSIPPLLHSHNCKHKQTHKRVHTQSLNWIVSFDAFAFTFCLAIACKVHLHTYIHTYTYIYIHTHTHDEPHAHIPPTDIMGNAAGHYTQKMQHASTLHYSRHENNILNTSQPRRSSRNFMGDCSSSPSSTSNLPSSHSPSPSSSSSPSPILLRGHTGPVSCLLSLSGTV